MEQALGIKEASRTRWTGSGRWRRRRGGWERAARLRGRPRRCATRWATRWIPPTAPSASATSAEVRAALGEAELEAAMAEGRAMTLEQAIAYALESE